jgi:hypothetical protein
MDSTNPPPKKAKRTKRAKTLSEPIAKQVPNFGVARYIYKLGFVVTDDVIQKAAKNGVLPLDGSLVVRLKKPVPCVFISFGLGGISLPDIGLCAIGDSWNSTTREENFALGNLMVALDFEHKLGLRMQWYLIDMKETDARVLKSPTDMELTKLFRTPSAMKGDDATKYKLAARVTRRRTTAGAEMPDGHEYDSDRDPIMVYLEEMIEKEERSEKARKKRLGSFPDTPLGWKMARICRADASKGKAPDDDPTKNCRFKRRPRGSMYPPRISQKRERVSYNADPNDDRGTTGKPSVEPVSSKRAEWDSLPRARDPAEVEKELFGCSSDDETEAMVCEPVLAQAQVQTAETAIAPRVSEQTERAQTDPPQQHQNTVPEGQQSERSDCEQEDLHRETVTFQSDSDKSGDEGVRDDYEEEEEAADVDYGDDD